MGIPKLNKWLIDNCRHDSIQKIHLTDLQDKRIAVDISIFLYRFLVDGNFMEQLYLFLSTLRYYCIQPVIIFDGKAPAEKRATIQRRQNDKKDAKTQYLLLEEELANTEDILLRQDIQKKMAALKKRMVRITWEHIDAAIELIKAFGFEYYLAPPNNTFSGKIIFIKSFTPNTTGNDFLNAANFQYNQRKWILSWQHEIVGENYNAEVGYVPRNNYIKFNPSITRLFFPKGGSILSHGPQITSTYYYNTNFITTDYSNTFIYLITYRDKSTLSAVAQNTFVELLSPFDPTRIGKLPLEKGTKHEWTNIGFDWTSPPQNTLTYSLSTRIGGYYANGNLLSISGNVGYRIQPYVNIDFSSTYNRIKLPSPWGNNNFLLLGPKLDVTFSKKLFLTTFFQYNEQTKNINFNTRFQWRYKPVSDLFIVYTDNYYIGPVFVKNRAVVLKFTYWWNK